jgi:hypothetical protein
MKFGELEFRVRALSRPERRKLRDMGINLMDPSAAPKDLPLEVLDMMFPEQAAELDQLSFEQEVELFKAVMEKTFGGGKIEKN